MTSNLDDPGLPHPAATAEAPPPAPSPSASRRRLLALVAVAMAIVVGALGWLFWSEGSQPPPPPVALETLPRVDGVLTVVERDRLVLKPFQPLDGRSEVEFSVPEQYRQYFDLAHLRSHASVGIPTRIYYLEREGALVAVYKSDAPVNSRPTSSGP